MSRKKNSRGSTAQNYTTASTLDEAGISFPAMFFGMVVSLLGIMLGYSYFQAPIARTKALEQVDSGVTDAGLIAADLDDDEFSDVIENGNVEQLTSLLRGVERLNTSSKVPHQLASNRRRVKIAKQLLKKPLNTKQRVMAVETQIDALSIVYGLCRANVDLLEPNIASTLYSTAQAFVDDGNPEIARTARLALFKHDAFELNLDQARPNIAPVAERILALMKQYPDDELVLATIRLVVTYYEQVSSQVGVNHGLELIRMIREGAGDINSPRVHELVQSFSDQARLAEVGLGADFENRWLNGPAGEVKLEQSCLALMSDPESGTLIFDRVEQVVLWFEQRLQLERTATLYQSMMAASKVHPDDEVAAFARKRAEDGLRRMEIANQPIDLTGLESLVGEHSGIIVLYWTPESRTSVSALLLINKETLDWRHRDGVVLAVTTGVITDEQKDLRASVSGIVFLESDVGQKLLAQCPSDSLPHVILIDKRGVVVNTNVPVRDLKTEAEFLMSGG